MRCCICRLLWVALPAEQLTCCKACARPALSPACSLPPAHRLFESVSPLLPDLVGRLSADISPFCAVSGLQFGPADAAAGPWRNYFVGLVGAVAADEDDILWPNQVRCCFAR